ncbi:hypothetical protein, partial [Microcoleus sp. M2_C4]
ARPVYFMLWDGRPARPVYFMLWDGRPARPVYFPGRRDGYPTRIILKLCNVSLKENRLAKSQP